MSQPTERKTKLELDSGGFGRLDISDLAEGAEDCKHGAASLVPKSCDWCREGRSGGGDYLVVADNRHFLICPMCWGQSVAYVELRQAGVPHETALRKLTVS